MKREEINKMLGMTEAEMDARAQEYETDAWDAALFKKVPVGRPPLADCETKTLTFKIPVSTLNAVESKANRLGVSRSEYLRALIDKDLHVSAV